MTLSAFRLRLKIAVLITLLIVYGIGSFAVGKYSNFNSEKIIGYFRKQQSQNKFNTPVDKPEPAADVTSAKVISSSVKLCTNTVAGFEVAYPKDWFTTYGTDDEKCLFFAPYSFVIPKDEKDKQFTPIRIEVAQAQDWAQVIKFAANPNDFQNVITTENIDINSKPAQIIKAITTGFGSLPKNFKKVTYLVFDSKSPLILTYQQSDEKEDTMQREETLKVIVNSLKYY